MLPHVTGLDEGVNIINFLIYAAALDADDSAECISCSHYILMEHEINFGGTNSGACEHSFEHGHCCGSPPFP
ncbi:hypothetical protein D3C81_1709170 [compost metagenome]